MLDNSKIYNYLLLLPNSKAKWTVFSFIFIFYSSLKSRQDKKKMLDNSKIYNYLFLLPNSKAKWGQSLALYEDKAKDCPFCF